MKRARWLRSFGLVAVVGAVAVLFWIGGDRGTDVRSAAAASAEVGDIGALIEDQEEARSAALVDVSMAEASLAALRENGALPTEGALRTDGLAFGLVHSVGCLPESCSRIVDWALPAGFLASEPILTLGHGGAEEFHIELRQLLAADAVAMTSAAATVADAVASLADPATADLVYDGWAPELVSQGAGS